MSICGNSPLLEYSAAYLVLKLPPSPPSITLRTRASNPQLFVPGVYHPSKNTPSNLDHTGLRSEAQLIAEFFFGSLLYSVSSETQPCWSSFAGAFSLSLSLFANGPRSRIIISLRSRVVSAAWPQMNHCKRPIFLFLLSLLLC